MPHRRRGPRRPRGRQSRPSWRRIASRPINGSSPTTRRVSGANWRRRPAPRAAARPRRRPAWASRRRPIRSRTSSVGVTIRVSSPTTSRSAAGRRTRRRMPSGRRRHGRRTPSSPAMMSPQELALLQALLSQRAASPLAGRSAADRRAGARSRATGRARVPRPRRRPRRRRPARSGRRIALQRLTEGTVIETVLINRLEWLVCRPRRVSGHDAGLFARPAARRHSGRRPRARRGGARADVGRLAARRELPSSGDA